MLFTILRQIRLLPGNTISWPILTDGSAALNMSGQTRHCCYQFMSLILIISVVNLLNTFIMPMCLFESDFTMDFTGTTSRSIKEELGFTVKWGLGRSEFLFQQIFKTNDVLNWLRFWLLTIYFLWNNHSNDLIVQIVVVNTHFIDSFFCCCISLRFSYDFIAKIR